MITIAVQTSIDEHWVAYLRDRFDGSTVVRSGDVADADVLVVENPPVTDLDRFAGLRFVQSTFAGPDSLTNAALPDGVLVARTTGGQLGVAMSEYVAACVLSAHRAFPTYGAQQSERRWQPVVPQPLAAERTIGLLGFGPLARECSATLLALGFNVVAWARSPRTDVVEVLAGVDGLAGLLARSDVVVNLLPLTPETHRLLDADAIAGIKGGASLVNCGRGATVDLDALVGALDRGALTHAWLDVFDTEPLPAENPAWAHPQISVTPHVASDSTPAIVGAQVAANITRYLAGETPHHLITN